MSILNGNIKRCRFAWFGATWIIDPTYPAISTTRGYWLEDSDGVCEKFIPFETQQKQGELFICDRHKQGRCSYFEVNGK